MNSTSAAIDNATVIYNQQKYYYESSYTVALPVYIIFMLFDLWILISLIHYGFKSEKWQQVQANTAENLNSGLIYISVIICAVFCFLYHFLFFINRFNGYKANDNKMCESIGDLIKTIYGLIVGSVNVFLWLRQRVFYVGAMSKKFGKISKTFSFFVIFIIFIGGISGLVLSILPKTSVSSPIGCVHNPEKKLRKLAFVIATIIIVFGQISLLFLLMYGLIQSNQNFFNTKNLKIFRFQKHSVSTISHSSVKTQKSSVKPIDETKAMVQIIMIKTFIFAILSIALDFIVLTVVLRMNRPHKRGDLSTIVASVVAFLNLLLLILSFVQWKEMITSPCRYLF